MNNLIKQENVSPEFYSASNLAKDCASFFSMHKIPFTLNPQKANIYFHESYLQVKSTLVFAVTSGEKIIKITGESGVGKTLLVNDVLSSIDHHYYPIRILNPKISPTDLLCQIINEFGRPYPIDASTEQLMRLLQFTLHEHYTQTNTNMLVWIDDAHQLPNNTLLSIDKISSWSTPSRALLQFILSGNNSLDTLLQTPALSSLKNNIRFSDNLEPIKKAEIKSYVQSCIHSSNKNDRPLFTEKALAQLHKRSNGNPSTINKLAYKSLLLAYGKGLRSIAHHYVNTAFQEENASARPSTSRRPATKNWNITLVLWAFVNTGLAIALAYHGGYL